MHRKSAAPATSSGSPSRRSGVCAAIASCIAFDWWLVASVSVSPGATTFPFSPSQLAEKVRAALDG